MNSLARHGGFALSALAAPQANPLVDWLCGGSARQQYARHKSEREAEERLAAAKWKLIRHVYGAAYWQGDRDHAIECLEWSDHGRDAYLARHVQEWSGREWLSLHDPHRLAAILWLDNEEIWDAPALVYPMLDIPMWREYLARHGFKLRDGDDGQTVECFDPDNPVF